MVSVPAPLVPVVDEIARQAFTKPTFLRFSLLMVAAILTVGRRTVSNMVRTVHPLMNGHWSNYHRVFCRRKWTLWTVARIIARHVVEEWCPQGRIRLAGDETVESHPGKHVYGKDKHRDAVRSTRSYTAFRWGHKWVVLAILVRFPFSSRPWALPILVGLYRSRHWNQRHNRKHRTPSEIMRGLLAVVLRWFPDRNFSFCGDGTYGNHALASFAARQGKRLTLVSLFPPDANIFAAPPKKQKIGRPRVKGERLPSPKQVVKSTKARLRLNVSWYGGGKRSVDVVTGVGYWYRVGQGIVEIRWVYVHDCTGTHEDQYFFTTDPRLSPRSVIGLYTGRWSIEVTFQELRAYLGLESTRCRIEMSVLREAPCLYGLYTFVSLFYASLPNPRMTIVVIWPGKTEPSFSDAITIVRKWLWVHWVFKHTELQGAYKKIPKKLQQLLLNGLAPSA